MSLTILVHKELPVVAIVRWFRDPKFSIDFASRPIVEMSSKEFRMKGHEWVRRHFQEYEHIRLDKGAKDRLLKPGEEKKLLKERVAIWLKVDHPSQLSFIPQIFRKSSLVDTENLPKEDCRTIPIDSPPSMFWRTFDDVVAAAISADN